MAPGIATLVFAAGILGLFLLDWDPKARTSKALWIAVIWLSIAGSRSVGEWIDTLHGNSIADSASEASAYTEGSPTDRLVYSGLLLAGLIVLVRRRQRVLGILRSNWPLVAFFLYCAVSIAWSDYPDVAFKRWIKALGDVVVVLIVLTDRDRYAAIKRVLAWTGFLLIPISVLFIKFYPDLGRGYHPWTWTPYYTGVTTNKNELGCICLVLGLGFVWRFLTALRNERRAARNKQLLAFGACLAMVLWLFWMANSMTSLSCFLLASALMAATSLRLAARKTWVVHLMLLAIVLVSVSTLFLDLGSGILQTMGRDPTLTGRTDIWKLVLGMTGNPVAGTGFESFWLGKRLEKMWSIYWWHPREAHDGYIEIFLNLGIPPERGGGETAVGLLCRCRGLQLCRVRIRVAEPGLDLLLTGDDRRSGRLDQAEGSEGGGRDRDGSSGECAVPGASRNLTERDSRLRAVALYGEEPVT